MSVRAVRHAGIVVRDAERSLSFYRDVWRICAYLARTMWSS